MSGPDAVVAASMRYVNGLERKVQSTHLRCVIVVIVVDACLFVCFDMV